MADKEGLIIFTAINDIERGEEMIIEMLEKGIIVSATVIPNVKVFYNWEGQLNIDEEIKIMIKTDEKNYPAFEQYIMDNHPYMWPEIIKLKAGLGSKKFYSFLESKNS